MRHARGFTLIEVLVALVVVALGMSALLTALNSSADTTVQLRERTLAEWVGFNQLAVTRLTATTPQTGSSEGRAEMAGRQWRWQQQVETTELPDVLKITVQVRPDTEPGSAEEEHPHWSATVVGFTGSAGNTPLGNYPDWKGKAFSTAAAPGGTPGAGAVPRPGAGGPGRQRPAPSSGSQE